MKFVHFSKTLPSSGPQGIKDDHIAHMLYLWHNNVVHPFNKCGLHSKSSITMSNAVIFFSTCFALVYTQPFQSLGYDF